MKLKCEYKLSPACDDNGRKIDGVYIEQIAPYKYVYGRKIDGTELPEIADATTVYSFQGLIEWIEKKEKEA